MKKLFIAVALALTLSAQAQNKAASDSTITDSTMLLTIGDYKEFSDLLGELPAKYANPLGDWLIKRFNQRAQQWMDKRKKQK